MTFNVDERLTLSYSDEDNGSAVASVGRKFQVWRQRLMIDFGSKSYIQRIMNLSLRCSLCKQQLLQLSLPCHMTRQNEHKICMLPRNFEVIYLEFSINNGFKNYSQTTEHLVITANSKHPPGHNISPR